MGTLNLIYACVQIAHNFGAVATVGSPLAGWWIGSDHVATQRRLAWLAVLGWMTQGASGAGFGITSYFLKGQLPDVAGVALVALAVKMGCALGGLGLAVLYLAAGLRWSATNRLRLWKGMLALAAAALSAAAFLRWFL